MENYADFTDAEKMTGKSEATLRRWIAEGRFPRPTHRRGKRLYWLRNELEKAVEHVNLPAPIASTDPTTAA